MTEPTLNPAEHAEVSQRDSSRRPLGLALSGGGFRASIFHLGVIRRLEELGIMSNVCVISSVSGGSIIAAYYAIEMERYLRSRKPANWTDVATRCAGWEAIASSFLTALDHNLRSRALVFAPFYHPVLFLKSVFLAPFRRGARSILIQKEYDRWFYQENTLDELPSVTAGPFSDGRAVLVGPKLVLNTTSLNTGERRTFSRDANTRLADLKTSNKNVLRLSQVVGASSGVPVLFPPTAIGEDLLVDGGISDNQGIEGLKDNGCNPMIISDACGQLELAHQQSTSEASVFQRVNEILQHQVRNKLLDELTSDFENRKNGPAPFEFVFFHLYLNLKDDSRVKNRVSSEYIQPIARIRTDLDQFSYVESEALLYHGYTLADAMVKRWCPSLIPASVREQPLPVAPIFQESVQDEVQRRQWIKKELAAGHEKVFVFRCFKKFWGPASVMAIAYLALLLAALPIAFSGLFLLRDAIAKWLGQTSFGAVSWAVDGLVRLTLKWVTAVSGWLDGAGWLRGMTPSPEQLREFEKQFPETIHSIPGDIADLLAIVIAVLLAAYVVLFPCWWVLRWWVLKLDRRRYADLTGLSGWSLNWSVKAKPPEIHKPRSVWQRFQSWLRRDFLGRRDC